MTLRFYFHPKSGQTIAHARARLAVLKAIRNFTTKVDVTRVPPEPIWDADGKVIGQTAAYFIAEVDV